MHEQLDWLQGDVRDGRVAVCPIQLPGVRALSACRSLSQHASHGLKRGSTYCGWSASVMPFGLRRLGGAQETGLRECWGRSWLPDAFRCVFA
jgi:hypothetical protein